MPYVRIEITDGATYEQKLQLYKETTEMLMRILNKKPEYTFVVIEEVDNKSWGHMGTSVHEIRMAQAAGVPIPAMGQKADVKAGKSAPGKKAVAKSAPIKRGPAKK
jgi:4-oxalocrotonate tautomerase